MFTAERTPKRCPHCSSRRWNDGTLLQQLRSPVAAADRQATEALSGVRKRRVERPKQLQAKAAVPVPYARDGGG